MKKVLPYLKPFKWEMIGCLVFVVLQSLADLMLPTLNSDIVDKGIMARNTDYIWRHGAIMLAVALGVVLCSVAAAYLSSKLSMGFGARLRSAVFEKVESFSQQDLDIFGTPSLITRTTNDVQQVQMGVMMTFRMLLSAPVMMVGGVIMAMQQDMELTVTLAIIVPLMLLTLLIVMLKAMPLFSVFQKKLDRVNQVMREKLSGVRVIRAFIRVDYEAERFDKANADHADVGLKIGRVMAVIFPIMTILFNGAAILIIWFGGHRIEVGMPFGHLQAFITYTMQILIAVMMATMMFIMLPRAFASAKRIREVLDVEPSIIDPTNAVALPEGPVTVSFDNVSFRYPNAESDVLHTISFEAKPGDTIAFIGSTGSGKSTLINLLPRFFDVTGGHIKLGGVDIRDLTLDTLRRCIGFIPQKAYLFSGTVASNLRYGNPNATDEQLWQALEVAQAKEFVESMENGLEAEISQGGTNVSGGQRQRLAIARALVANTNVYIFDDSFSALDFKTDSLLRAALKPRLTDAIQLIVAQRVSTIRHADAIMVLEDGRAVGYGTHDQLMTDCAVYREIALSQLNEEEAAS